MIIKHEINSLIAKPKREDMLEFLTQSLNCICKCKETLEIIQDTRNGELDEFECLDSLEMQKFDDMEALRSYVTGCYTKQDALILCARDTVNFMGAYNKALNDYVNYGMILGEEELISLEKASSKVISQLAYIARYEFNTDIHLEKLQANEEYVDEIFKMYCDSYQISLPRLLNQIESYYKEFPFRLSIFDDFPEYEAPFEAIMGPYMGGLIEKDLTEKQIKDVIDGKITPEDFMEMFVGQGVDDSDNSSMHIF